MLLVLYCKDLRGPPSGLKVVLSTIDQIRLDYIGLDSPVTNLNGHDG